MKDGAAAWAGAAGFLAKGFDAKPGLLPMLGLDPIIGLEPMLVLGWGAGSSFLSD